jgi:lipopolysaccharide biosynthesis protein
VSTAGHSRLRQVLRPRTRWNEWRGKHPFTLTRSRGWGSGFSDWLERTEGRRTAGFPEVWRARADLPIVDPARVGVVLHAFYAELLPELFDHISRIPVSYDLIITNATGAPIAIPEAMGPLRNVRVLDVDNHGRDILPLVSVVNAGCLDPYLVVLKVHTKRSEWRAGHELAGDGDSWRTALLDALLGSSDNIAQVVSAFAEHPSLGVVTADGSVLGPADWGDNQANVATILRRIELHPDPDELRFAAGSMYWTRAFVLQGLRSLNLSHDDFEPEKGQVNQTTAHAVERIVGALATEAGLSVIERSALEVSSRESWRRFEAPTLKPRARIVPFYLPQFHPIPENDKWWGTGFTEWTNVAAARPVYEGQHQPKLPADLGFYDLRLDDVRRDQLALANDAGIAGFMYYYYWFASKRLLEAPIEALLKSDIPQPFCIMWANENWTRRWDGRESDVLIAQDYEHVPAERFIDDIVELLADPRYMTIGGRKIIAVYRPGQIPDFGAVVATWRRRARDAGLGELYLMHVDVGSEFDGLEGTRESNGLDGMLSFPPHNHLYEWIPQHGLDVDPRFRGNLLSYAALVSAAEDKIRTKLVAPNYPGAMVAFDNTPRRQMIGDIWYGSNPYTFRRWLATAVRAVMDRPPDERVVFINAWNEWAEGAVLEPNDRFGPTFLQAVRDVALA